MSQAISPQLIILKTWIFALPNVSLKENVMEDPHDFLVPLWQLMTMAGGSFYDQCGEHCVNRSVHMNMMFLGLSVTDVEPGGCNMTTDMNNVCLCWCQTKGR